DEMPQDPTVPREPLPSYEELMRQQAMGTEAPFGTPVRHQERGAPGRPGRGYGAYGDSQDDADSRADRPDPKDPNSPMPFEWTPLGHMNFGPGMLGMWNSLVRTALCTEVRDGVL